MDLIKYMLLALMLLGGVSCGKLKLLAFKGPHGGFIGLKVKKPKLFGLKHGHGGGFGGGGFGGGGFGGGGFHSGGYEHHEHHEYHESHHSGGGGFGGGGAFGGAAGGWLGK